ncbi:response regulator [Mucilaginibacter sp. L3T2-6]|uniref:response regulator n=1 Tax=Mucilaginibacter sp. L3T2-6 TaxID=3062491 RepID=UPI002676777B|nr:response regulator [Mucilaginibacter sp. L3T2-6]MDO3644010.1 response regulator [Mucilaginibacter sp. L3T2-6]MDV6216461.1 response regulator [Mucilaginibacter sp. L3T2-6]
MMNNDKIDVLLVEDNPHDAEMTIRALAKVNLANKLHHVKDGVAALDFIFARGEYKERQIDNKPKIVLLDIKMPKVDGIEVLKQIKADEITRTIPVVIMTSSKEEQDIITSYNLGVNSYVVKPVDFAGFAKAVSELGFYWLITNQSAD